MEQVSDMLVPYGNAIGILATLSAMGQSIAPMFVCRTILKQKSTGSVDPLVFIGGLVMTSLLIQIGLFMGDKPTIIANMFGFLICSGCSLIFYRYSKKKMTLLKPLSIAVLLIGVVLGYARTRQDSTTAEYHLSLVVTALGLMLMGGPLLDVKKIMKNRSAHYLPFPMILSGTNLTFWWLLYGLLLQNVFMIFQNATGFALCATQMFLIAFYSGGVKSKPNNNKNKKKKSN